MLLGYGLSADDWSTGETIIFLSLIYGVPALLMGGGAVFGYKTSKNKNRLPMFLIINGILFFPTVGFLAIGSVVGYVAGLIKHHQDNHRPKPKTPQKNTKSE